jgi:hypothetical protein
LLARWGDDCALGQDPLETLYDAETAVNNKASMTESPFPTPAQLVDALCRLDVDLLAGWVVSGDEAREHLRDRIRRIQARAIADAIDQFLDEQEDTLVEMLGLVDDWAEMLQAVQVDPVLERAAGRRQPRRGCNSS